MSDGEGLTPEQYEILFGTAPPPQTTPPGVTHRNTQEPGQPPAPGVPPPPGVPQQPMAPPPPPTAVVHTVPFSPPRKRRGRGCLVGGIAALLLGVAGCTAALVIASNAVDDAVEDLATGTTAGTSATESTSAERDAESAATTATTPPETIGGTREVPFAFGSETTLVFETFGDADGSKWNTTIGPIEDIGAAVAAENAFNDPPPEGVVFAGFTVVTSLIEAEKEPLSPGFNFKWEIIGGATAAVYDPSTIETESFGCGVTPDEFDDFSEVFVGGTLTGTVCIPLPVEDLTHANTRVALNFTDGDRIHFGP